jgi:hypothetical protein
MPKLTIRQWLLLACALLATLVYTSAATHAHDGDPRLELSFGQLNPGAPLEVRGVNIATESTITIKLVSLESEFWLGEAVGDAHGDFIQTFVLPSELAAGHYTVLAVSPGDLIVSAPLDIAGAPMPADGEEGELREEEDPLLATLPPGWNPAPNLVVADSAEAVAAPAPAPASSLLPALLALLGALLLIGLAVGFAARRRAA